MARTEGKWKKGLDFISPADDVPVLLQNSYLNFGGSLVGSDGYGFRDNSGTMQYKNSGGSWLNFGGGGGGLGDMTKAVYDTNDDGIVDEAAVITDQGALATMDEADLDVYTTSEADDLLDTKQPILSEGAFVDGDKNLLDSAVQPGDLAAVGTSGDYNDLSNKPDLSVYDNFESFALQSSFPATGSVEVLYLETSTGLLFRWNGSSYSEISAALALGETSSTAYRGDRGKIAYDHTLVTTGNPHNVTKADVGLGSVPNTDFTAAVAANTAKVGVTTEISELVEDTTPTLGGNLDGNGMSITDINELTVALLNFGSASISWNASGWINVSHALRFSSLAKIMNMADPTAAQDAATKAYVDGRALPRVGSTTSSATPTINTDNVDVYRLTAQAVNITSFTSNLSGTPVHGQKLMIEITGTAARTIAWGASFEASTIALPTTTDGTSMLQVGFMWNSATSKWRCVGVV